MRRDGLRVARILWGMFVYAVGIVLTVDANLGVGPWDVLHQGLSSLLGITFGSASILTGAVIVAFTLLMKEQIGFGTFGNMILIGLFVDILLWWGVLPEARTFLGGLVMMVVGLFVISFATFFYIGAGYGAGPRDSLMVVLTRRSGLSVGLCRALIEGSALICGWLLGGHVGAGTVIYAFGFGLALQVVFALLRFDVRAVHHETLAESCTRMRSFLQTRAKKG